MIVHTQQVTTNTTDDPGNLDFHIALTYPAQAEQSLKRIFGTVPDASGLMVAVFDIFRDLGTGSSSDILRQSCNAAAAALASAGVEFVIGEWQCLLTVILFFHEKENAESAQLDSVLNKLSSFSFPADTKPVYGASSPMIFDFESLPGAAAEVIEAIQYSRYIQSPPAVIALSKWEITGGGSPDAFPALREPDYSDLISRLIHVILNEGSDDVRKMGSQCAAAIINGLPRSSALHFIFIIFCRQLERSLIQFNIVDGGYLTENHLFPQMLNAENEAALRHVIGEYLQQIWVYHNQKKYSRFADSMRAAMALIDNNLTDPMLSISMIAEELSLTTSTLTAHFRQYYGDSIPNTIHKKRIARIRDALLETDAPARQIAVKNGYVSVATFNRAFLKYEGIYPNAFRTQHKHTDADS